MRGALIGWACSALVFGGNVNALTLKEAILSSEKIDHCMIPNHQSDETCKIYEKEYVSNKYYHSFEKKSPC